MPGKRGGGGSGYKGGASPAQKKGPAPAYVGPQGGNLGGRGPGPQSEYVRDVRARQEAARDPHAELRSQRADAVRRRAAYQGSQATFNSLVRAEQQTQRQAREVVDYGLIYGPGFRGAPRGGLDPRAALRNQRADEVRRRARGFGAGPFEAGDERRPGGGAYTGGVTDPEHGFINPRIETHNMGGIASPYGTAFPEPEFGEGGGGGGGGAGTSAAAFVGDGGYYGGGGGGYYGGGGVNLSFGNGGFEREPPGWYYGLVNWDI